MPPHARSAPAAASTAVLFAEAAMQSLATRQDFRAALCGGEPLAQMLRALRALPAWARMEWQAVQLFAVDDGWDEAAMQALAQLPLPRANLHRPRSADIGGTDAARDYEERLRAHFGLQAGQIPLFDFMLLRAGPSGRLAGHDLHESTASDVARWVVSRARGTPRVMLALPVIDAARRRVLVRESPDL